MGRHDNESSGGGGGEISMSIEETNKLRISLGLKPLAVGPEKPKAPSEEETKQKQEADASKTAEIADRIKAARERRTQQELLAKTKTLGEADDDVDDVMAWVNKSRTQQPKKPAAQKKGKQQPRKPMAADSDEEQEEGAAELAGMKVAHGVEDLDAGESLILTLEDKGILDEKGNLIEDEAAALENVLLRETKKRTKAYEDSRKTAKPLWEEDGKRRSILDKYDEEEEEIVTLGDAGTIAAANLKKKEDISAKLAAGAAALLAESVNKPTAASDYFTPEEVEAMKKPKKKKERKLKKKTLTGEEMAALEADAAARGDNNLGSRKERKERAAKKAADEEAAVAEKRSRFDHALAKANYASLALRPETNVGAGEEEGEDDELYKSLHRARQLAQRSTTTAPPRPESIAEDLIRRREEREKAAAGNNGALFEGGAVITLNDMEEFTRNIAVKQEEGQQQQQQQRQLDGGSGGDVNRVVEDVKMEDEVPEYATAMDHDANEEDDDQQQQEGTWAAAGEENGSKVPSQQQKKAAAAVKKEEQQQQLETEAITVEKSIGRGLGAALDFLKERGELKQKESFAGRTNDSRDSYFTNAMGGFKDLYTGGQQEDKLALDVEIALTRRDEYGRILTPKEAFRQLCHKFHGIYPSRNTKEKRAKQIEKELAQNKAATGATESASLGAVKRVQQTLATPYVVLSGNVKPGQSRDATAGYATVNPTDPWDLDDEKPRLGGDSSNAAPLMGNAKVEMMLGVKRPAGGASMPPPPPKVQKKQ